MKKILFLALYICSLYGCTGNSSLDNDKTETTHAIDKKETLDARVKRHIESALAIPSTEEYTYEIWQENLDEDSKLDAIITVNRLQYALEEASKASNAAQRASIGFMGNNNYIFYYDGGLDKISPQIAIPSSPKKKLVPSFVHISSEKYKDILIDYRILNASYKAFYTVKNHLPNRIFEWKNFDILSAKQTEAFIFEFDKGSLSYAKDILIYEGKMKMPIDEADLYNFEPEIEPTDKLKFRFFFHPETGKYMTKK